MFSRFFACDVIQVIQVKQIDFCCIRLLQLGNIAKKISSIWLLKHFEQFQEHYKMANKSLFCFPLIQVRKLFKGGNYLREESIKFLEVLTAETIQRRKLFKGRNYSRKYGIQISNKQNIVNILCYISIYLHKSS